MHKSITMLVRQRKSAKALFVLIALAAFVMVVVYRVGIQSEPGTNYEASVVHAMSQSFMEYWESCSGHDEYEPSTFKCQNWLHMGATAVDSIDTLLMMGLTHEYRLVRDWAAGEGVDAISKDIAMPLNISASRQKVQVFELVIRLLGGFNSAHALAPDADKNMWRMRAIQVGNSILHGFNTKTGCPRTVVLLNMEPGSIEAGTQLAVTAEIGTLQLEMRTLSAISNDLRYASAVDKCERSLLASLPKNRVAPREFHTQSGRFDSGRQSIGGGVDSFVEMLLKTWIAFGKKDTKLREVFEQQVEQVFTHLTYEANGTLLLGHREPPDGLHYGKEAEPIMEHLSCFFPGVLALGALHGLGGGVNDWGPKSYMTRAHNLTRTCFLMSRSNPLGLAPEAVEFEDGHLRPHKDADYSILRPEIVESIYLMYAVTKKRVYREWGRVMWEGIMRSGTLQNRALTSTFNMNGHRPRHKNKLHSFVLAETLKYFYLLFKDEGYGKKELFLKNFVFNTEAHPVRVRLTPPGSPILD